MRIFHDGGAGHSTETFKYVTNHVLPLLSNDQEKVKRIHLFDKRVFSMEIVFENDMVILLSGTGSGYLGTAPTVSTQILTALGVPEKTAKRALFHKHLQFDFENGKFKEPIVY